MTTQSIREDQWVGTIAIKRTHILGTRAIVYSAWEPGGISHSHTTITTIGGARFGRIHTRTSGEETFAHLRGGSPERIAAVRAWYAAKDEESYAAILTAYPEAADGVRSDGDIEVVYG